MTIEEVKGILSRARFTRLQVDMLQDEIESIRADAEKTTASLTGMPGGGDVSDKVGNGAARMVDTVSEKIAAWQAAWEKADALISTLEKPEQQLVLRTYYLSNDLPTWEKCCVRLDYSWRNIHYIHKAALKAIAEKIA